MKICISMSANKCVSWYVVTNLLIKMVHPLMIFYYCDSLFNVAPTSPILGNCMDCAVNFIALAITRDISQVDPPTNYPQLYEISFTRRRTYFICIRDM